MSTGRVVVKGRLNDICPPDGYGAYAQVRMYIPSDSGTRYNSTEARDIRGCKPDAKRVLMRTGWRRNPYKITIQVREYDADTGDYAFRDADRVTYSPDDLRNYAP